MVWFASRAEETSVQAECDREGHTGKFCYEVPSVQDVVGPPASPERRDVVYDGGIPSAGKVYAGTAR